VVDETVTDNFQFFSDSQDFLEGLSGELAENLASVSASNTNS
jgi:hypothetical protein